MVVRARLKVSASLRTSVACAQLPPMLEKWTRNGLSGRRSSSWTSRMDRRLRVIAIQRFFVSFSRIFSSFFPVRSCSMADKGREDAWRREQMFERNVKYIYICVYSVVGRRRFRILQFWNSKYRCRELWIVLEKFVLKEENLKFDIWSSRSNVYVYVFEQRENTRFEMRKRGNKKWRVGNVDFFIFLEQRC